MKRPVKIKDTFQNIMVTRSFDRLEPFKAPGTWKNLPSDEKQLLASLFIMQGEHQLKTGEEGAREAFDLAERVTPSDPKLLYRIGLAYASQRQDPEKLHRALRCFAESSERDPKVAEVWEAWGMVLVRLGRDYDEFERLPQAAAKFEKALECRGKGEGTADLLWNWGECWASMGRASGEAMDFRMAIEKYRQAASAGARGASFWTSHGDAVTELGLLINRPELLLEAVEFYQRALSEQEDFFPAWLKQALTLKHLYERTNSESMLVQACETFEEAARLDEDSAELWMLWGELLAHAGWTLEHIHLLQQSAEKLARADVLQPDQAATLSLWGTVLMHCGSISDRLPLLKQGEGKILRALDLDPQSTDTWCAYGSILTELGRYFSDQHYYEQAVARFHYALTLDAHDIRLWSGLGSAQLALGELIGDGGLMEKALESYAKTAELDRGRYPEVWADWGVALLKVGDLLQERKYIEAAVQRFEQAIHLYPEGDKREIRCLYHYGTALDFLGDFYEDSGFYERAVQVLTQVLHLDPHHRPARYSLALAYFHLGEVVGEMECFQRALELFEQVIASDEEDEMAWNDWGLTLLSLAYMIEDPSAQNLVDQKRIEAESKLTRALSLGCLQSHYNLACLYSLCACYEESLHHLQRALQHQCLPPVDDLLQDEWLAGVRETDGFQHLLNELLSQGEAESD